MYSVVTSTGNPLEIGVRSEFKSYFCKKRWSVFLSRFLCVHKPCMDNLLAAPRIRAPLKDGCAANDLYKFTSSFTCKIHIFLFFG